MILGKVGGGGRGANDPSPSPPKEGEEDKEIDGERKGMCRSRVE